MNKAKIIITIMLSLLLMLAAVGCSKSNVSNGQSSKSTEDTTGPDESKEENYGGNVMPQFSADFQNCIIEIEGTVSGEESVSKLYRLKSKGKTDIIIDGKIKLSQYSDFEKNIGYAYQPDQKKAHKDSPQGGAVEYLSADMGGDVDTTSMKKSGNEKVNGFDCTVYKEDEGPYAITAWVYEKNKLVMKYEVKYVKDGKIARSYTITKFQVGGVTDEMVTLPKDAKLEE